MRLEWARLIFLVLISLPCAAAAGKADLLLGAYQFSAVNKRNSSSKSLSGAGSYYLGYRHPVGEKWELAAGYSLLATKTVGGDLSFGFDLGINYFFLTPGQPLAVKAGGSSAFFQHRWRPYAGLSFHQRNFQSTSSQYAGPGVRAGAEFQMDESWSLQAQLRYLSLGGPNSSTASQTDLLVGIMCWF